MQQAEATASEIAKSNRKAMNGRQTHAPPDGARQSAVSDAQLNVVTRAYPSIEIRFLLKPLSDVFQPLVWKT
jgi:hypothetical protein